MIQGAAIAPRMPPTPAAVETRPIDGRGDAVLHHPQDRHEEHRVDEQVGQRAPDGQRPEVRPAQDEADALGHVVVRLAAAGPRGCGADEVGPEAAEQHPRDGEGDARRRRTAAQRVTAYRMPPSGPPTREAMCWRAWLWLSAVDSSSGADDRADRRHLRRAGRAPLATPVSRATTARCGTVRAPSAPADGERGVEEHARAARGRASAARRSTRSASTPAGSRAPHMPSRKAASTTAAHRAEPLRAIGDEREDEHAHRGCPGR